MEGMQPGASSERRSYTDLDPPSQWRHEEEGDTLIIDVAGFRKEQMKVLITTSGSLKISGERPLDGNRWLRFFKNFTVSKNCNPKIIQAKFDKEEGLLYVVLPKKVPQQASSHDQYAQAQEPLPNTKANSDEDGWKIPQNSAATSEEIAQEKFGQGMSNLAMGFRKNKVAVVSVVIAIVVIVGIGVYLGYRLSS